MAKTRRYTFNPKTLSYEVAKRSKKARLIRSLAYFAGSLVLASVYFWLYVAVFGLELPKTLVLKKKNAEWISRMEVMNRQLDKCDETLTSLQMRDDDIYRSIFGMHEIPSEVRNAGFGGVNRYEYLDVADHHGMLRNTVERLDVLTKKSYVQS